MASIRRKGEYWYIRYRDAAGREHEVRTGTKSKREAQRLANERQVAVSKGQAVVVRREKLRNVYATFKRLELPSRKEATRRGYGSAFVRWLEVLGDENIAALTPERIQNELASFEDLKPSSRRLLLARLSGFLAWAEENGYLAANPCRRVRRPVRHSVGPSAISPERAAELLSHVCERYRPHLSVLYLSGIRLGEFRALTWSDIHGTQLSVSKAVYRNGREAIEREGVPWLTPKTGRAIREVHMVRMLLEELQDWAEHGWWKDCPDPYDLNSRLMFPSMSGHVCDENALREALANAVAAVREDHEGELDWITDPLPDPMKLHGLRAGYARLMLMSGMTIAELRQEMGHSNIETTARYAQWQVIDTPASVPRADRLLREFSW